MYIGQAMKNEHFMVLFNRELETFLTSNEVEFNLIHKLKKKKKDLVQNRLKDFSQGLMNETL